MFLVSESFTLKHCLIHKAIFYNWLIESFTQNHWFIQEYHYCMSLCGCVLNYFYWRSRKRSNNQNVSYSLLASWYKINITLVSFWLHGLTSLHNLLILKKRDNSFYFYFVINGTIYHTLLQPACSPRQNLFCSNDQQTAHTTLLNVVKPEEK